MWSICTKHILNFVQCNYDDAWLLHIYIHVCIYIYLYIYNISRYKYIYFIYIQKLTFQGILQLSMLYFLNIFWEQKYLHSQIESISKKLWETWTWVIQEFQVVASGKCILDKLHTLRPDMRVVTNQWRYWYFTYLIVSYCKS